MDRVAAFLGVLALAAATGALAVGDLVVVPGLSGPQALLDANLAIRLAGPLHLRCAEITLVAVVVLALTVPRWLGSRVAMTMSLLAIACATISRFVLLPAVYSAWAKVDLVASRPVVRLSEATELARQTVWLDLAIAALLIGIAVLYARQRGPRAVTVVAAADPAGSEAAPAPA